MSSNSQHIIINRDNYQEFFLLYIDGELSPEQCDAVERFAVAHPDLQEELDLLLTTRLDAEPVAYLDKESLLAESMKASVIDESLLLYIDDELKGADKASVEKQINSSAELQFQYQLLQRAKLDKSEQIAYPNKEELYRATEERRKTTYWWQVAAAVAILLGWSIFSYMDNSIAETQDPVVAVNKQPQVATSAPSETAQPEATGPSTPETTTTEEDSHIAPEAQDIASNRDRKRGTSAAATGRAEVKRNVPTIAEPAIREQGTAYVDLPAVSGHTTIDVMPDRVETIAATPQQNINNPAVTTTTAEPYNIVEASQPTGVQEAVVRNNDKKGSLRGFLRKTTRFIERRTGIDPTNGDDELMIGAVAIKL